MKIKFFSSVAKFFLRVWARKASPLPIGDAQFEVWFKSIAYLYDLPENDSVRFALSTMVMHLPPTEYYKSKRYFGLAALKGASNQTVHAIMSDCKTRQDERNAAAKASEESAKANPPQLAAVPASEVGDGKSGSGA